MAAVVPYSRFRGHTWAPVSSVNEDDDVHTVCTHCTIVGCNFELEWDAFDGIDYSTIDPCISLELPVECCGLPHFTARVLGKYQDNGWSVYLRFPDDDHIEPTEDMDDHPFYAEKGAMKILFFAIDICGGCARATNADHVDAFIEAFEAMSSERSKLMDLEDDIDTDAGSQEDNHEQPL